MIDSKFAAHVKTFFSPDRRIRTQEFKGGLAKEHRHPFTFDNGKEFTSHEELSRRTGMAVYFADPYCSWQRGTNENTNGLVRQFLSKGTDLAGVSAARIYQVEELLNHRPRRCLGYRTAHEQFTGTRTCCI